MNTDAKTLNKTANHIQQYIKKDYTPWSSGIYPWDTRMVKHTQITQWDTTLTKLIIEIK